MSISLTPTVLLCGGQTAVFNTGTHDWQFSRRIIESDKPFASARAHLLFRNRHGSVWFKDVRFGVWDEERQQIVENLLWATASETRKAICTERPTNRREEGRGLRTETAM